MCSSDLMLARSALSRDDRHRLASTPTQPQHLGEIHERVRLRVDPVGSKCEIDRLPCECLSRVNVEMGYLKPGLSKAGPKTRLRPPGSLSTLVLR